MKFSIVTIFLVCILLVAYTKAFCVYNEASDGTHFFVRQYAENASSDFSLRFQNNNLAPQDKTCCNYHDSDCNKSGNPNDIIKMGFIILSNGQMENDYYSTTMPAGGWLEIYRDAGADPTIQVYNPDGTRFTEVFLKDSDGGPFLSQN